ncbi:MAG: DUF4238 domain-containing protein [Alphaproteobacteria bacterium]|nr:DUF4238 domain-containing protein [Alphaproteobacteria bacterium]MCW5743583.1 DUF4238 domain-containing protein [Alphaproteobacteria bacterium]
MRHHYVPVFYLKQWAEQPDGKVPFYQWINDRIVPGRRTPENTGYEDDLYAKDKVPDTERHIIEESLFSPIDNAAAPIHRKMLQLEDCDLTPDERAAWAVFLIAANARVPGIVNEARAKYAASAREAFLKNPDEYERAKGSASEATFVEWIDKHYPGLIDNFGLDTMARHITNSDRIREYVDLKWSAHTIPDSNAPLITTDRPLWFWQNPSHPQFSIVMPLSPRSMFVAAHTEAFAENIARADHSDLAAKVNASLIHRARERVYGRIELSLLEPLWRNGLQVQDNPRLLND